MIERTLQPTISHKFFNGKAIIILGPRQVGKTTLIHQLIKDNKYLFIDGDDPSTRTLLKDISMFTLTQLIGKHNLVFIDEAQRIPNIGTTLKMVTDRLKNVQLLVSGSSAFEINNKTAEPLTGRKWEYQLYPISWEELEHNVGFLMAEQQLEHRLIYGMYPDVINNQTDERQILQQLAASYLYKDVLSLTDIRKPEVLDRLLKALALQLGNEVSYNELANLLGIDKVTVMRYIDVLEKCYIIFQLNSFSRNQRNEIKNNRKIYFYDNGIRNVIINNLNPLDLRNDKGALWENFLITERLKMLAYYQQPASSYFWRTVEKQEIDYVEDANGQIMAYEFKWKQTGNVKIPKSFIETYGAVGHVIDRTNFREFLKPAQQ